MRERKRRKEEEEVEVEEGRQGGAKRSSTKNLEINISSAASSGGERALTWPRV